MNPLILCPTIIFIFHIHIFPYIYLYSIAVESYHIDRSERILPDNSIEHRESDGRVVVHKNFLKKGPITIGVTSGASTPDK